MSGLETGPNLSTVLSPLTAQVTAARFEVSPPPPIPSQMRKCRFCHEEIQDASRTAASMSCFYVIVPYVFARGVQALLGG
jgi:hypothetical protein